MVTGGIHTPEFRGSLRKDGLVEVRDCVIRQIFDGGQQRVPDLDQQDPLLAGEGRSDGDVGLIQRLPAGDDAE